MATLKEHVEAGTFPKHLQARHFDQDAPVHPRMADRPNWMNEGDLIEGEPIYVAYNGTVHPVTNLIHVDRMLLEGGRIVAAPKEG